MLAAVSLWDMGVVRIGLRCCQESEMQSALASMEKVPDLIERWLFPEEEEKSIDKQMKAQCKLEQLHPALTSSR
eukprot:2008876-Amphidinium_carterae.1